VPLICPHDLFRVEDRGRASQSRSDFADISRIIVTSPKRTSRRALQASSFGRRNNKCAPRDVAEFMLMNDSVTVAIEIPIWLTDGDIAALENQLRQSSSRRGWGRPRDSITRSHYFLQGATAPSIFSTTADARTNSRLHSWRSTRSPYAPDPRPQAFSTSNAPGSTRRNISEFFPRTAVRTQKRVTPVRPPASLFS